MRKEVVADLTEKFIASPGRMNMGAGKASKRYNVEADEIREAKRLARLALKIKRVKGEGAKILLFDIETSPLRAYVWRTFKQNIYLDQLLTSTHFMLTWAAKWLGEEEVFSDKLAQHEVYQEDDKRIVQSLHKLIDEADIVIAHFGDKFDVPMFNGRCLVHDINPPKPYRTIDTKQVASKHFKYASNKLDGLATIFGIENKISTDFKLWADCLKGDEDAMLEMEKYNVMDVIILEKVYLKMRPWIKSHPNLALYGNEEEKACPNCGSKKVEADGFYYTNVSKFQSYRCSDCGSACGRERKAIKRVPITPNAR